MKKLSGDEEAAIKAIWTDKGSAPIRDMLKRLDQAKPKRPSWDGFAADWESGCGMAELAQLYGRTEKEIYNRAIRMKLTKRQTKPVADEAMAEETISDDLVIDSSTPPELPNPYRFDRPSPQPGKCCWPDGIPGSRSFRFCDEAVHAPYPYCLEHAKKAYIKLRDPE